MTWREAAESQSFQKYAIFNHFSSKVRWLAAKRFGQSCYPKPPFFLGQYATSSLTLETDFMFLVNLLP